MNASLWLAELEELEQQAALLVPTSIQQRMQALNALSQLMRFGKNRFGIREDFRAILPRAADLQQKLEAVNNQLFDELREQIRQKKIASAQLRTVLNEYTTYKPHRPGFHHDTDGLNTLINGVFETSIAPDPSLDAVLDMVYLEMVPTSAILELVDRIEFTTSDTFVDIGSGQGQNCLMVHLLTGARTLGIDIEPAYVQRAEEVVQSIQGESKGVTFVQGDARKADYDNGTVFFMFTPFLGRIFQQVMAQLERAVAAMQEAGQPSVSGMPRPLVCTYGDITLDVATFPWLQVQREEDLHPSRLAIFEASA